MIRRTTLAAQVAELLLEQGIETAEGLEDESAVVFADFCGLDSAGAFHLACDLHNSGCRAFSFWRRGPESFYGPFTQPGLTACWHCFSRRFSDSIADFDRIHDCADVASPKVVADNLLLALRYPEALPSSCVLVDNGEVSTAHSIVPVPWCDVCGFSESSPAAPAALVHSDLVPADLRVLADPRGGVVRHLFFFEAEPSEAPAIPVCCSVRIAPVPMSGQQHPEIRGEGKGATRNDALRSAVGEGLERYAASIWRPSELIFSSFDKLDGEAFDPRWLVLYDDEQYSCPDFPYAPFRADQPLHWKSGKWLDTGAAVYLPAVSTYMNFLGTPADLFTQTTSNGLAAGSSDEDATLRAMYEMIERDAFMIFWLARLPAAAIETDDHDQLVQRAIHEAARMGARIELYCIDTGTDHPTIVCFGLGDGSTWPGVTVGLGTHADVDVALRKAVFEHNHYGSYMRQLMLAGEHKKIRSKDDVKRALDHGLYYIHPSNRQALDWFRRRTVEPVHLAALRSRYRRPATVSACVSCLLAAGVRVAAAELTSPDIRFAPVRVVRCLGTWMQPIHFGTANRRLRNPRLQRLLADEANSDPHPVA